MRLSRFPRQIGALQAGLHPSDVALETLTQQTKDVFKGKHHGPRLANSANGLGPHVPGVIRPKSLSAYPKRLAGRPARKSFNAFVWRPVHLAHIEPLVRPIRHMGDATADIVSHRCRGIPVTFNEHFMFETRTRQPQCKTATTREKLCRSEGVRLHYGALYVAGLG